MMKYQHLVSVTGTITDIYGKEDSCCLQVLVLDCEGQPVHAILSPETWVVDALPLRPGMRIVVFYDGAQPVPLIYPPQYKAFLAAPIHYSQHITLKWFDQDLVASDQSLKLNLSPYSSISALNGQPYLCSPGGHFLLVYYSSETRSIPPQTTPDRVIVLCPGEIER